MCIAVTTYIFSKRKTIYPFSQILKLSIIPVFFFFFLFKLSKQKRSRDEETSIYHLLFYISQYVTGNTYTSEPFFIFIIILLILTEFCLILVLP